MKSIFLTIVLCIISVHISNAQWVQVNNGMGNRIVRALAFNGNNIFAGTDTSGVYLSTNNGLNWIQTSLNNRYVYSLGVNGNNVFAGTYISGVYLSTDNGTSWTQTSLNNRTVWSLAVNGNNIFAGTEQYGIFRSTNNGISWISSNNGVNGYAVYSLAFNGNSIYAGVFHIPHGGYYQSDIYVSQNNGANWSPAGLINKTVYSLAVNGNSVIAGTGLGVFFNTNNDTSWTQTSLNNRSVRSLAVNGNNIYAGTLNNGVYVSNDNGANWIQRNEGLGNATVRALCILNNYIFAGTSGSSVYRRPLSELVGINPISNEIPNQFSLSQNYPNPFNPTTKIRFALPKSSFTTINVYDALGRAVETIVNEQLNSGIYEVEWDASDYTSGVYFYKLTSEAYSETKKMVLMK